MKNNTTLKRNRINEELNNIFSYPLTIVTASMGYGKTTAVKEYLQYKSLQDESLQVAWISLLGSEGSEEYFWYKLTAQIRKFYPEMGKMLAELGFPADAPQTAKLFELIWDKNDNKKTIIVIDDYHLIEDNEKVSGMIELIAQEEIPDLHTILLSRTRPKLNMINLTSKKLCYIIGTETLAFTLQEVKEYFAYMRFEAAPRDIERIHQYTNGWISAIYLLFLGLKQGLPVTGNYDINQLVEKNLFRFFDEQTKDALVKLAIFDSFTIKQASYVLKSLFMQGIIERLFEQNAFIEYDKYTGAYKLHNILLDFLRAKQSLASEDTCVICRRAGEWYFANGNFPEALKFYYQAGEADTIFGKLNSINDLDLKYLDILRLVEILLKIPQNMWTKYPFVFLQIASISILNGDIRLTEWGIKIFNILKEYFENKCKNKFGNNQENNQGNNSENSHKSKFENVREADLELWERILAEIHIIHIFIVFNDAEMMVAHTKKAIELLKGNKSSVVLRGSEFTFGSPHFLYSYYRDTGKLKETVNYMVEGFPLFTQVSDGCGTGCEYITLAEYALETCDFDGAYLNACKAIYKAKTKEQTSIIICANFTLMRLYILQGKFSEALDLLMLLRRDVSEENNAIYNTTMDLCEGYIYGCLKMPENIPLWLRTGDMTPAASMFQGMAFNCIIYCKSIMLVENWVELEIMCESFKESFAVFQNQLGFLHNSIYAAIAKYKLYGSETGKSALLSAIEMGKADNIIMPFAENCDFILPILNEIIEDLAKDSAEDTTKDTVKDFVEDTAKDDIKSAIKDTKRNYAKNQGNNNCLNNNLELNYDFDYIKQLLFFCKSYSVSLQKFKHMSKANINISKPILTEREIQVLRLLSEGFSRDEIARKLFLSVSSIKTYLQNIYHKLDVHNKIMAVKRAEDLKII